MKNIILLLLFIVISISACNKVQNDKKETSTKPPVTEKKPAIQTDTLGLKPEILIGSWVKDDEYRMGFDLKSGGKVSSINMATLDYNSWKLDGNKLILNSTSKGVSNPATVDEVYIIRTITPAVIVLSPSDDPDKNWTYNKK